MKNDIIHELRKFSPKVVRFGEKINDDRIEQFERKFNLILPSDYKELMKTYNSIGLFGKTIYGISDSQEEETLASVYEREHHLVQIPQPLYLVPFSTDGGGNFYCFDTREIGPGQSVCPIVFWESNVTYTEEDPEIVNDCFFDWVMDVFIGWTLDVFDYDGTFIGR